MSDTPRVLDMLIEVNGAWFVSPDDATDLVQRIETLERELAEARKKYSELLYQVATVHKGESRHDTAKRYISEREAQTGGVGKERTMTKLRDLLSNIEGRNWSEDVNSPNGGQYLRTCIQCEKPFIGHQHRTICKLCTKEQKEGEW